MEEKQIVKKLSAVGIFGNVFLAAFKLLAGLIGNSGAMVSDAVHSLSDVFATFVAFLGVQLSKQPEDDEHPYGHERLECVASLILGLILAGTGLGIGYVGVQKLVSGEELEIPTFLPLIAAVVSIAVKEGMFWYTMYYAKKCRSSAFKADAWHYRSDALSSIGALIGIVGARMGFPILDQIAGIVICIVIIGVAVSIFRDALSKMLDTACDDEFENELKGFITDTAKELDDSIGLDVLRTRKFGEKIYVDAEISADGDMTLKEAHDIADGLHDRIEEQFPDIKHVMIHVNPAGYHYKLGTDL